MEYIHTDGEKFGTGGIQVPRNEMIASFGEIVADSPTFDWNKGFDIREKFNLSLKNQNGSGSCGGQASAYLTEPSMGVEMSARSIYAKCFVPGGGSGEVPLMNVIMNIGVAKESDVTSYENSLPPSEAFMETDYPAVTIKKKGIRPVYISPDFDSIATAVLQNNGAIIGITGCNNGTWISADPLPVDNNLPKWNHWLYVGFAGMRNGRKVLGVKNSWGAIGEDNTGWQYLTEDHTPFIFCAWSMIYQNNVKPSHTFITPMVYGQASKEIITLQDILRYEGFFSNVSTGYYGDLTAAAVQKFQMKYEVDTPFNIGQLHGKRVGLLTIKKLNSLYGK